jgi:hypothetical protein
MSEPRRRRLSRPGPVEKVTGDFVTYDGGWTFGWPEDAGPVPQIGQTIEVETVNFSTITGAKVDGEWRFNRTDEYLDEQHRKMIEGFERDKRERLAACRSEWIGQEEHLPNWGQRRLARFREAAGETFELDGWGYELAICRLAAAYVEEGVPPKGDYTLPPKVKQLDEEMGCSGNQHDCARALARLVLAGCEDAAVGGVPAGMSPLTGSVDYST